MIRGGVRKAVLDADSESSQQKRGAGVGEKCPKCGAPRAYDARECVEYECGTSDDRQGRVDWTYACKTIAKLRAQLAESEERRDALEAGLRDLVERPGDPDGMGQAIKLLEGDPRDLVTGLRKRLAEVTAWGEEMADDAMALQKHNRALAAALREIRAIVVTSYDECDPRQLDHLPAEASDRRIMDAIDAAVPQGCLRCVDYIGKCPACGRHKRSALAQQPEGRAEDDDDDPTEPLVSFGERRVHKPPRPKPLDESDVEATDDDIPLVELESRPVRGVVVSREAAKPLPVEDEMWCPTCHMHLSPEHKAERAVVESAMYRADPDRMIGDDWSVRNACKCLDEINPERAVRRDG